MFLSILSFFHSSLLSSASLLYLLKYFPELKPIEICFSAVKFRLHGYKMLANSTKPNWEIGYFLNEFTTPHFFHKVIRHCGYCVPPPHIHELSM
ncbi:hypothetical protein VP01_1320g1 [Puccinia sorghi]|uniref:Uncharacterized protein n=1 Tax=Puccinia sorghi TaxID=27349 RepID=A0A0L6VMP3_9BASI|nr:hypothetical protein VP01_1320g1 [Puccinia sorghi]